MRIRKELFWTLKTRDSLFIGIGNLVETVLGFGTLGETVLKIGRADSGYWNFGNDMLNISTLKECSDSWIGVIASIECLGKIILDTVKMDEIVPWEIGSDYFDYWKFQRDYFQDERVYSRNYEHRMNYFGYWEHGKVCYRHFQLGQILFWALVFQTRLF